jgi:hypothetical protein
LWHRNFLEKIGRTNEPLPAAAVGLNEGAG